jgi:hypothetical protein
MTIDRRDFLAGAACVTAAPVLGWLPGEATPIAEDASPIVFMIDGWSAQDAAPAADQVWIRVGHTWRAAWR